MSLTVTSRLPPGDDLGLGLINLMAGARQFIRPHSIPLMRVVCRELLAQGVTHALIDYEIRAGDKYVEDVTCWRDRLLLDSTAWPMVAEPAPEYECLVAPVSVVALVQRLVFRVMPHHRLSLNSDNLFGTATLEVATQRLVFRSHHQPDPFHYLQRHLPLGDLPAALQLMHHTLFRLIETPFPEGRVTLHASAWTGWKISRYIFAGHDVPRQQSAALEPLIDTCGIDLLDAVRSILRVVGIARPLGTGSCSLTRTGIWVGWDQCARGLLDETWEVL